MPSALAQPVEGEPHVLMWMLLMGKDRRAAWGILTPLFGILGQQDRFVTRGMKTAIPAGAALHAAAEAVQRAASPRTDMSCLRPVVPR